jgi:hypothetical protein
LKSHPNFFSLSFAKSLACSVISLAFGAFALPTN